MPLGKSNDESIGAKERIPEPCCSTVRGFFLSFIVSKHTLGYSLPLSCLSSHLLMKRQTTSAATVTKKVMTTSMKNTSSRCRVSVGQHRNYNISIDILLSIFQQRVPLKKVLMAETKKF